MSGATGVQDFLPVSLSSSNPSTSSMAISFGSNSFSKDTYCLNLIAESPMCSATNFVPSNNLKRWNSVPSGINFAYPPKQSIGSSSGSSSTSSDVQNFENNDAAKGLSESMLMDECSEKNPAAPMYLFERRPSSASPASVFTRYRYSTDAVFTLASPVPLRLRDKGIEKLKREANIRRCIEKDYASEKLSVAGAAIMGSLDEFSIEEGSGPFEQRKRTQSLTEPVHVMTNFLPSPCSPSPTRIEKQCYSPSMQQVVRGIALSPATSPSPSRHHHCVRSLSPIAVRGASLKRKYDSDTESNSGSIPPAKRIYSSVPSTPPFTPLDRFLRLGQPAPIDQSLSANSMDSESSNSTISSDYPNIGNQQSRVSFCNQTSSVNSPIAKVAPSPVGSLDFPSSDDVVMDETGT